MQHIDSDSSTRCHSHGRLRAHSDPAPFFLHYSDRHKASQQRSSRQLTGHAGLGQVSKCPAMSLAEQPATPMAQYLRNKGSEQAE